MQVIIFLVIAYNMGIPAYFKHLTDTHMGLLTHILQQHVSHLHLDLNCAVYHCVYTLQKTYPYDPLNRVAWELVLCDRVFEYIQTLAAFVQPTKELNIAIDGVVPMAKMRQQRQRRFKGAYLRAETARIAKRISYPLAPTWDTTAITPGTEFMTCLSTRLNAGLSVLRETIPDVVLSCSECPGEGEHKNMESIRSTPIDSADMHVVYGLDADLIMLTMLQAANGRKVCLLREAVEFGKIKLDGCGKETLVYFDICRLARIITHELHGSCDIDAVLIRDYVFMCSLLGNDFVSHGFSLTIHDDGIERLISIYNELRRLAPDSTLVVSSSGSSDSSSSASAEYNPDMLSELFRLLAEREGAWLRQWRKKREGLRPSPRRTEDPLQYELALLEDFPLSQMDVELAWDLSLDEKSRAYYYEKLLGHPDVDNVCNAYLKSLIWTLQYYSGGAVDTTTYYAFNIPPLWCDLFELLGLSDRLERAATEVHVEKMTYILPKQQAAAVFPASSYELVDPAYRGLPDAYPEYFPTTFKLYTVGKRFLWQCEPMIPLFPIQLL
jgi:5'-3' exonuclease